MEESIFSQLLDFMHPGTEHQENFPMELHGDVLELLQRFGVGRRDFDDPLFGDKPPARLGIYDLDEENLCHKVAPSTCGVPGCRFASETLLAYEEHYNSAHRYACSQCKRLLPSPHLLDLHLQETHDSFFAVASERKPSYSCYIEECKEKFMKADERFQHCVKVHKLPKDFRFEQAAKKTRNKKNKRPERMEIAEESEGKQGHDVARGADTTVKAPKNFRFGHSRHHGFTKSNACNVSYDKPNKEVDMDEIISDLKESLPM